jgi:hypothetical protein
MVSLPQLVSFPLIERRSIPPKKRTEEALKVSLKTRKLKIIKWGNHNPLIHT